MAKQNSLHQNVRGGIKPLVVVLVLVVLACLAGIVWYFYFRPVPDSQKNQIEEAKIECHSDDETLCEYITSWEEPEQYRFTIRETKDGTTNVSVYEYDLRDTPKIYTRIEGGDETITIGNTLYTKWHGFWSKESLGENNPAVGSQPISKPSPEDAAPIEPHNYEKAGQESCGDLNCYKYKITDPQNPDLTQHIWFDDTEYKLRQLRFEQAGTISEQTFEYVPVKIEEPSPVREQ